MLIEEQIDFLTIVYAQKTFKIKERLLQENILLVGTGHKRRYRLFIATVIYDPPLKANLV